MIKFIIAALLSYLLGSCSTGILVSKLAKQGDIRSKGSGNIGATNILRVMGKKYAVITLLGDMLKGIIAVLISKALIGGTLGGMIGSLFAVLGHNFPIFFGFKGGKGIATSFGSLLLVMPIQILICFIVFVITVALTRYVSLGSILAAIAFPIGVLAIYRPFDPIIFILCLLEAALAIWRHRANIERLIQHKENKVSFRK